MSMRGGRTERLFRRSLGERDRSHRVPDERAPTASSDPTAAAHGSEELSLAAVLDASGAGHWQLDRDDGRLECSPMVRAHLGLDAAADLTSYDRLRERVHPEDRTAMDAAFAGARSGETFVVDVRVAVPNGDVRWLVLRGSAHRAVDGSSVLAGIVVDITAHRVAESERERLLEELASQRARLAALLQNIPAAIIQADAATGRITFANSAVDKVFPIVEKLESCHQLVSKHPAKYADERVLEPHERPIMRALAGEAVSSEDYRYTKPGHPDVWVRISACPIRNEAGVVTSAVVVGINVDREKRVEAVLRESEARMRQFFQSPVTGAFSSCADGRITDANDEFLRMIGYRHEDVERGIVSWRELTPPELHRVDDVKLEELITTGSHPPFEKEFVRKDGTRVPVLLGSVKVDAAGSDFFTIALDMSDKRRAERERESLLASLERSEERYRLAALATNDVIWDWDLHSNRMQFRSLFDADPESLTPYEDWTARLHPSDRDRVVDGKREAVEKGHRHWEDEYRLRRPDGSWMTILDRGYIAHDATGRPTWMVGASRDVTARRRQQEFERQLIGIVSHDLKNPLQTILLATELLTRASDIGTASATNVERIRKAAERANRMIRDLLDFTRARVGTGIPIERREVRLGMLVNTVLEETRAGHPDRTFKIDMSGDLTGAFDADRLTQVLTNLVDNALRYSPRGSTIRTELRGRSDDVLLLVHNDGPPISAEVLPRIFEPLQRGEGAFDSNGRSVGLGLYIVKHLVEGHGGRISVHSSETSGTEFRITLPRVHV